MLSNSRSGLTVTELTKDHPRNEGIQSLIVLANTRRSGFLWEQIEKGKLVKHNPEVIDDLTLFLPSSRLQYKRWLNDRTGLKVSGQVPVQERQLYISYSLLIRDYVRKQLRSFVTPS
jgi:hypothetical protein